MYVEIKPSRILGVESFDIQRSLNQHKSLVEGLQKKMFNCLDGKSENFVLRDVAGLKV